jgi:hypothetical protein
MLDVTIVVRHDDESSEYYFSSYPIQVSDDPWAPGTKPPQSSFYPSQHPATTPPFGHTAPPSSFTSFYPSDHRESLPPGAYTPPPSNFGPFPTEHPETLPPGAYTPPPSNFASLYPAEQRWTLPPGGAYTSPPDAPENPLHTPPPWAFTEPPGQAVTCPYITEVDTDNYIPLCDDMIEAVADLDLDCSCYHFCPGGNLIGCFNYGYTGRLDCGSLGQVITCPIQPTTTAPDICAELFAHFSQLEYCDCYYFHHAGKQSYDSYIQSCGYGYEQGCFSTEETFACLYDANLVHLSDTYDPYNYYTRYPNSPEDGYTTKPADDIDEQAVKQTSTTNESGGMEWWLILLICLVSVL